MSSPIRTIVVTGGAGFVGSHLIEALVKDPNNRVISLDNYFTGSKENHIAGAEYREGHTKDIARLVPEAVDMIYHLGEYSRVAASLNEPDRVWDLNIAGTLGVLEYWRTQTCKLLYAGSSTKFTEARDDGVEGRDLAPYTWAKAANTELVANYGRWYALPYVTVYFYNVYGPRERPFEKHGTVIETYRQQVRKGEPCVVREPGTQMRCFTHVEDTVAGLLLAADKGQGDGYGIGADDCHSLPEVVEMMGGMTEFHPATKTTRSHSKTDSSKIEALGWKPTKTLKEYVEHFRSIA